MKLVTSPLRSTQAGISLRCEAATRRGCQPPLDEPCAAIPASQAHPTRNSRTNQDPTRNTATQQGPGGRRCVWQPRKRVVRSSLRPPSYESAVVTLAVPLRHSWGRRATFRQTYNRKVSVSGAPVRPERNLAPLIRQRAPDHQLLSIARVGGGQLSLPRIAGRGLELAALWDCSAVSSSFGTLLDGAAQIIFVQVYPVGAYRCCGRVRRQRCREFSGFSAKKGLWFVVVEIQVSLEVLRSTATRSSRHWCGCREAATRSPPRSST